MSITGTSPDVVQSLEFLMSRFFSGTRLQSGPSLDKIQKNIEKWKFEKMKNLKTKLRKMKIWKKRNNENLKKIQIWKIENFEFSNFWFFVLSKFRFFSFPIFHFFRNFIFSNFSFFQFSNFNCSISKTKSEFCPDPVQTWIWFWSGPDRIQISVWLKKIPDSGRSLD